MLRPTDHVPSPSSEGRVLSERYRLHSSLGRGGMGTVWLATDESEGRDVVVKEIRLAPELSAEDREMLCKRAMREARAIARLNHHPCVVKLYDVVQEGRRPWLVMEYVPSQSLAQHVEHQGPLPFRRVAEIGVHVLDALRAAHAAGVVHRDVKPGNVLLGDDGRVVLTDFGLAAVEGDPSLTQTGLIIGSPAYIAPERARAGKVGPESDLWSLGATLYLAVEGSPPYDRRRSRAILRADDVGDPEPMTRAGPLEPILEGLLQADPSRRMSAAQAASSLRRVAATRETPPAVNRHPRRAPTDGSAGLDALRGLTHATTPGRHREPAHVAPGGRHRESTLRIELIIGSAVLVLLVVVICLIV